MSRWRLLPTAVGDAARNMAVDEYMAAYAQEKKSPVIRFYRWQPAALSIGYFQKHAAEVNETACAHRGIHWIRRPTGGRAVLHQHEITYCVAMPLQYEGLPSSVTESYRWLSQGLVNGLRRLGLPAQMWTAQGSGERGVTAACFDSPSRYELLVEGRKVVGSAQVRRGDVLLQHGSVLLDFDLELLLEVMAWESPRAHQAARRLLTAKAGSIKTTLGFVPPDDDVVQCLLEGFASEHRISWNPQALDEHEERRVEHMAATIYRTDSWNRKH